MIFIEETCMILYVIRMFFEKVVFYIYIFFFSLHRDNNYDNNKMIITNIYAKYIYTFCVVCDDTITNSISL